jgi:hypothetical protein
MSRSHSTRPSPPSPPSPPDFKDILTMMGYVALIVGSATVLAAMVNKNNPVVKTVSCHFGKEFLGDYCRTPTPPSSPNTTSVQSTNLKPESSKATADTADIEQAVKTANTYYESISKRDCRTAFNSLSNGFKEKFKLSSPNDICGTWKELQPKVIESAATKKSQDKVVIFAQLQENNTPAKYVRIELERDESEKWKIDSVKHLEVFTY